MEAGTNFQWIDVHCHHRWQNPEYGFCRNAFHYLEPEILRKLPYGLSIGLHPWQAENGDPNLRNRFLSGLKEPNVLALGECGLDRTQGAEWNKQLNAWNWQFDLAQETSLPIIIHCVRAWSDFLPFLKRSDVPMLFHGFSGKLSVLEMLLPMEKAWFSIGPGFFGQKNWEGKLQKMDLQRLTLESDSNRMASFSEMTQSIALVLGEKPEFIQAQLKENAIRFFGTKGRLFF